MRKADKQHAARLVIGGRDHDGDAIQLRGWTVHMRRGCYNPVPWAEFVIARTPEALSIDADDVVEFYRLGPVKDGKRTEEPRSLFAGVVDRKPPHQRADLMTIKAYGPLIQARDSTELYHEFTGTLEEMAHQWLDRYCPMMFEDVHVSITQPDICPDTITVHNASQLSFWHQVRQFCPVDIQTFIEKHKHTIEILDERLPTGKEWGRYGKKKKDGRILKYHREAVPSVRKHRPPVLTEERLGHWAGVQVVDEAGKVMATAGDAPHGLIVRVCGTLPRPEEYARTVWDTAQSKRKTGFTTLHDPEMRKQIAFRNPSGLLKLDNTGTIDGLYAVQTVRWHRPVVPDRNEPEPVECRITFADLVYPHYIPDAMPNGPTASASASAPHNAGPLARMRGGARGWQR